MTESRRRRWAGAVVVAAGAVLAAGPVHAEDASGSSGGRDAGTYVLVGALAVNAGFTIYDLATIGEAKPAIYGFGEVVIALPQAAVFGAIALLADEDGWIPTTLALWTAGLAAHGIYTLATGGAGGADPAARSERPVILSFGGAF